MRYLTRIALGVDVLINVLLGGDTGQTISARAGIWAARDDRGPRRRIGGFICGVLDGVDPGHCAAARAAWRARRTPRKHRHYPYEGKIGNGGGH